MTSSTPYSLKLINGTTLVWNEGRWQRVQVEIAVTQGKIAAISSNGLGPAEKTIDCRGLTVLPGLIDSQVHFREPGLTHKEDIASGSQGAALGGITCFFEMPNTNPPTTTRAAYRQKMEIASQTSWVDYAFYVGGSPENIEQLAELESDPHTPGIKVFMGSSTGNLLVPDDPTLKQILLKGSRRVTFHSEDEFLLKARRATHTRTGDVSSHPEWRSVETALSSTERLLALAEETGRPVHVLHVSSAEEMEFLKNKKHLATVEVLPQFLTFCAEEIYERIGTLAQQNPPIRSKHHQDRIWQAVLDGTVDVIGSDHAPHTLDEKAAVYPASPSGMPGVQTLVPVMLNHVAQGKLSLEKMVELLTWGPQKVFGLRNKGWIGVGADADFTIVDLQAEHTITNAEMACKSGWTAFDGMRVKGWPIMTIVRGNLVMQEGTLVGSPLGKAAQFC